MPFDFADSKCDTARAVENSPAAEPTPALAETSSRDSQRNFSNTDAQSTVSSAIDKGNGLQIVGADGAKSQKEHSVLTKVTTLDRCGRPHTELRDPKEHSILTKVTTLDNQGKSQAEKPDPKEHSILTKVTELGKDGKSEKPSLEGLQKQAEDIAAHLDKKGEPFNSMFKQYMNLQKMYSEAKQLGGDPKATMESALNAALKDTGHKVSIVDSMGKNAPKIFWQNKVEATMVIDPKPGRTNNMGHGIIGLGPKK